MAGTGAGDLRAADLVGVVQNLLNRVKALELAAAVRAVTFVADASSTSSASYVRMAWSSFARSGSQLAVNVSLTLSGATSVDLQLRADGTQIGVANATGSGTVVLSGFLPASWDFGAHKTVEVQARVNAGSVTVAVVGASHR
ncbi:hypothetical protein GCM10022252_75970 [Streptosporangium oxazolinicum]|uniref:Uncharacterized protein n=1 Tax=Streptosporangium oxazolinicum TaxID=909287 RepID=A0ABP8BKW3_9ACTN